MRFVFAALREASIPLVASTDAGIPGVRHDRLAFALPALADFAQLTARETLRTATSDAARALGLDDTCGVLRAGRSADVLVVRDDPLENLAVLEDPLFVVARGRVMRDELGVGGSA
jgi:imidazolonepropionase-like amidohydrolase